MKTWIRLGSIAAMVVSLFWLAACEDDSGVQPGDSFTIKPSGVVMGASQASVYFTAEGGHPPFNWSISDGSLGSVTGKGSQVTYTRKAVNGINVLSCLDSEGWSATTTITQQDDPVPEEPIPVLTVSPATANLARDGERVVFTAAGGEGQYRWSVEDTARGTVTVQDRTQALYERKAAGNNTVVLYDEEGHVAVAAVTQPNAVTLVVSPANVTVTTNGLQVFTASGGTGAYAWTIITAGGAKGTINPGVGVSTLYTSTGPGTDQLQLSDGVSTVFAVINKN